MEGADVASDVASEGAFVASEGAFVASEGAFEELGGGGKI